MKSLCFKILQENLLKIHFKLLKMHFSNDSSFLFYFSEVFLQHKIEYEIKEFKGTQYFQNKKTWCLFPKCQNRIVLRATFTVQTEIWQNRHAYVIENGTTSVSLSSPHGQTLKGEQIINNLSIVTFSLLYNKVYQISNITGSMTYF